ncbi:MAG: hypothetical protein JW774_04490, partial [Candidatus Aureabacteria bacterium]|nr:hypothetical protein [Candidatus Auribacterota bacterium]
MNLLFVDLFSPEGAPYEPSTLEGSALGGTEATALRVATGLSEHHRVWFAQKSRQERVHYGEGLEFLSYSEVLGSSFPDMDAIIVLKRPRGMDELRIRFPSASLFLWLHDYLDVYPFRILRRYRRTLLRNKAQIIAVSRTHARATASLFNEKLPIPVFRKLGWAQSLRVGYVYNPIPDDLMPDGTKPDLCSLIFFSSPNKGLEQVMELFFLAKKHLPLLKF